MSLLGNHPALLAATYRNAVVLLSTSGAFTSSALRDALPFTGYSEAEVDEALNVLVTEGDLVDSPLGFGWNRLFLPGPNWPVKGGQP